MRDRKKYQLKICPFIRLWSVFSQTQNSTLEHYSSFRLGLRLVQVRVNAGMNGAFLILWKKQLTTNNMGGNFTKIRN